MMHIPKEKLDAILARHRGLGEQLVNPSAMGDAYADASREYSELNTIVETILSLQAAEQELLDAQTMLADPDLDAEMKAMCREEMMQLEKLIPSLQENLQRALIPKDKDDARNVILEVRAGTGGDEAGLFAAELFHMYRCFSQLQGWRFEENDVTKNDVGGIKEASATITGRGAFGRMKFESGVHRVQRVPKTEGSGRIHTSAATVAILPEAEEVDIAIRDEDIRIDTMRASGAGGQHVNTTDSAVRITHLPTGLIVVACEKSQHQNRRTAMQVLRARLYDMERQKLADARSADRKGQVGSGDRSERIRTYNFPQGRVTDHRVNVTLYKIEGIMIGEGLDEIIDALLSADEAERLASMDSE
ncbi:MAG: peptide chain release factor 1 [Alphaproteobacteria bacterium]|nr:MAG: peptide chain release factor 1 [Alphaproteobacteria bacterium]